MKIHGISWDLMGFNGIGWMILYDFMEFHGISMELNESFNGISMDFMEFQWN